ncbi:nitroreductase family protein [Cytobacillus sp. IB215665]|uniref:nitroreductase family protein n=1 Tax=Cytobacillus sp. IB215665 TaxID=3097357 RepID=UPI002A17C655|nr:nitroreductase family protein [Cytobacillus sp. IB215665]MDX8365585.1 nitroreductase family protein [Cytobacillus sp. IB215665]
MAQSRNASEEYLNKIKEIKMSGEKPKELTDQNFFTVAQERSSIRHYDPEHKMSESDINEILETAILAPSSSNLQPWRFLVIHDQESKEQLLPIANNQQQIVDASVVIAVLGDLEAYKNAERIYGELVTKGAMTEEIKKFYVDQINGHYGNLSFEDASRVAMIDGGIVSMQLMLAAKAKGLDTVPMGGFNPDQFIKEFNVPENFSPVMLISVGKAKQVGFAKSRLPLDEVTTWNKF